MADLKRPAVLYTKGALFVATGLLACVLILLDHPTLKTALLLALAIWSFARAYYFAFYVVEHYVDPGYRFAGLVSFARYLLRRRKERGVRAAPLPHPDGAGLGDGLAVGRRPEHQPAPKRAKRWGERRPAG